MIGRTRTSILTLLGAVGSGLLAFSIFFSDPVTPDGLRMRIWIAGAVSLAIPLLLSYVVPARWWLLALVSSWGSITTGLMGVLMRQDAAVVILVLPLTCAMAGAYYGAFLGRRRITKEPRPS